MSALEEKVARALNPKLWKLRDDYAQAGARLNPANQGHVDKSLLKARAAIAAVLAEMDNPPFDPEDASYHEGMTRLDWWRAMLATLRARAAAKGK